MAGTMTDPIRLPMIDLSDSNSVAAGKALLNAAVDYGFLYIDSRTTNFKNIDVERAFKMSSDFFSLPLVEKEPYRRGSDNNGWVGMHVETLDPEHHQRGDFKEALNIGELNGGKVQQALPQTLLSQEQEIAHFVDLCNETCTQILQLLGLGLGIPKDFFTSRHDSSKGATGNALRLLYYPSNVSSFRPEKDIRAGAHSDYGSITLLFQRAGQPGLEILKPDQTWSPVPVYPADSSSSLPFPPILVNIGDMLSYWTHGLLKSTIHRVVFPGEHQGNMESKQEDRYSIAFFCQPVHSTKLIPVPSKLVEEHGRHQDLDTNKPTIVGYGGGASKLGADAHQMTAGEHLQSRLAATYLKSTGI